MRAQLIGVSATVREDQINHLTPRAQDEFIREVGQHLEQELRKFTNDARPLGDLAFQVTGPHLDPIQGRCHVHTLAGNFDLDTLSPESAAYLTYVTNGPQEGTPTP